MLTPGAKVSAHVELFKRDEQTGKQVLVSTTRPCAVCGKPVDAGIVIPLDGDRQAHADCRRS